MKIFIGIISLVILRCCWGPTDYQLMSDLDEHYALPKELDGRYSIAFLEDQDVSALDLNINFNNETKEFSGFSGCNRFFGTFNLAINKLSFSSIGSTKMLCNDETTNKTEDYLIKVFDKANTIFFTRNGFSLFKDKKLLLQASKDTESQIENIEYSAYSRSFYKKIIINENTIIINNQKGSLDAKKPINKDTFQQLIALIKSLKIENLSKLTPPSQDHHFDGAALARLQITKGNKTYETKSFDHGNPPPSIANLVKEMLSLEEKIE